MARVLIAGCGYVGCELARRLVADRHEVWGLRRRPQGLPDGLRPLAADLTDAASLRGLPADLEVVVYAAAADTGDEQAYRSVYVEGPRVLLAALADQGQSPRRVLFTSSTAVYGQSGGEWVDESSPTEPEGFNGRIVLDGERIVLTGPFPGTVVRFGGIYGPHRVLFAATLMAGEAVCSRRPQQYVNLIHRDDCAGALAHLARLPEAEECYVAVDREPADRFELLHWLAERLGASPPRVVDGLAAGRGRGSKRCSSRLLQATGWVPRYPTFREGFAALIP